MLLADGTKTLVGAGDCLAGLNSLMSPVKEVVVSNGREYTSPNLSAQIIVELSGVMANEHGLFGIALFKWIFSPSFLKKPLEEFPYRSLN